METLIHMLQFAWDLVGTGALLTCPVCSSMWGPAHLYSLQLFYSRDLLVYFQEDVLCSSLGGTCIAEADKCFVKLEGTVDCPDDWCCLGRKSRCYSHILYALIQLMQLQSPLVECFPHFFLALHEKYLSVVGNHIGS